MGTHGWVFCKVLIHPWVRRTGQKFGDYSYTLCLYCAFVLHLQTENYILLSRPQTLKDR
jgi:hypothetical protein